MRATLLRAAAAAAAAVNMTAAAVLGLVSSERAVDVHTVYDWARSWLVDGQSLYATVDLQTDYPPNAIVMLSPLALVPRDAVAPIWAIAGLALALALPWLAFAVVRNHPGRGAVLLPALLFLCWGANRTILQFSALSLALALVTIRAADTHGVAAGVALGFALAKPHIAGPVALWALATRRIRLLLVAAAVVAGLWAIYDARIGENPITTVAGYARVIEHMYGADEGLVGRTSIRRWIDAVVAPPASTALWLGGAALLFAFVWWMAIRRPRLASPERDIAIVSLFCLCSLLSHYHNSNNLILLLPAFVYLWVRRRWLAAAVLQAALTFDLSARMAAADPGGLIGAAMLDFNRVLVVATFVYVAADWTALTGAGPDPPVHARVG